MTGTCFHQWATPWPMVSPGSPVKSLGPTSSLPAAVLAGHGFSEPLLTPLPRGFSATGSSLTCPGGPWHLSPLCSLKVKDPRLLPLLQPGDQLRLEDQESCCGDGRKEDHLSVAGSTAQGLSAHWFPWAQAEPLRLDASVGRVWAKRPSLSRSFQLLRVGSK